MITTTTTLDSKMDEHGHHKPNDTYPNETYNPKRVQKYLDAIDCINDKYERQIERIIKRRDEQTSLYNLMISQERAKTQQGE